MLKRARGIAFQEEENLKSKPNIKRNIAKYFNDRCVSSGRYCYAIQEVKGYE